MISWCDAPRETNEARSEEWIVFKEARESTDAGAVFDGNLISYQGFTENNGN